MRRHWIAAAALFLAACTPMQWVRSDVTPEQAVADEDLCRELAARETRLPYIGYGPFGPWMYRDTFGRPLFFPPGGPFFDPTMERYHDEARLTDFCMRAKGYQLEPLRK
jgi:hypothetical protein